MKKITFTLIITMYTLGLFGQDQCVNLSSEDSDLLPQASEVDDLLSENSTRLRHLGAHARSGGWSGNGGDFGEVSDNIWFLGNKKIPYCIKSSNSFPISKLDQISLVENSIAKWKVFYQKYNLLGNLTGQLLGRRPVKISFPDKVNRSINFNFEFNQECEDANLVFHFGVENKVITDYKKYATEHPYGFAVRQSYNHTSYMNHGVIWVKEIKDVKKIEHTVLHELGHILGMKHDSVYIMRSVMAQDLDELKQSEIINEIETTSWPYRFKDGSSIYLNLSKKPTRRSGRGCDNSNAFKLGKAAKQFSSLIKVEPSDCVLIEVRAAQAYRASSLILNLNISNLESEDIKVLKGTFGSKRKTLRKKKGPGVFTRFLVNGRRGRTKEVWRKAYLDKSGNNEISGSFKSKSEIIPAKLTQDKGAILDLYLPRADKWISLKSYHE